jgi:hypothetical protein
LVSATATGASAIAELDVGLRSAGFGIEHFGKVEIQGGPGDGDYFTPKRRRLFRR